MHVKHAQQPFPYTRTRTSTTKQPSSATIDVRIQPKSNALAGLSPVVLESVCMLNGTELNADGLIIYPKV